MRTGELRWHSSMAMPPMLSVPLTMKNAAVKEANNVLRDELILYACMQDLNGSAVPSPSEIILQHRAHQMTSTISSLQAEIANHLLSAERTSVQLAAQQKQMKASLAALQDAQLQTMQAKDLEQKAVAHTRLLQTKLRDMTALKDAFLNEVAYNTLKSSMYDAVRA